MMIKKISKVIIKGLKYSLLTFLSLLLLAFLLSFWPPKSPKINVNPENIILLNGNVITMEHDSILYNQNIVIESGRIKRILSSSAKIHENYKTIDLRGKFVMPGLIDMHVHLFDESDLYLYLSQGITTVRNLSGFPKHIKWREQIKNGNKIGPLIVTSGPQLDGENTAPNAYSINSKELAEEIVLKNAEKYDWIKVYDGIDYESYKRIISVAKNKGLRIAAHMPRFGIDSVIVKGLSTIEHFEQLYSNPFNHSPVDQAQNINRLAELLNENNVAVCPTIITIKFVNKMIDGVEKNYLEDSLNYMPALVRKMSKSNIEGWKGVNEETKKYYQEQLKFHLFLLNKLHDAGITIVAGTDSPAQSVIPAFSLLSELELYQIAGLSNFDVLKTATINSGKVLGLSNTLGVVKQDAIANLLVLNANPLNDLNTLRNPYHVIQGAKLFQQNDLKYLRDHAKENHRSVLYILRDFLSQIIYTR